MNGPSEYDILSLAVFTLNWKIFMISVVCGYCIVLTAQVLCINTKDRAPHQVFLEVVKYSGTSSYLTLSQNLLLALFGFSSYLSAGVFVTAKYGGDSLSFTVCGYLMLAQTAPMLVEAVILAHDVMRIRRQGV